MSKTTKALAILGVVAGLGVATMPMRAMALTELNGTNTTPATDKVVVKATIKDYISIELNGVTGEGTFDATTATDSTETDKFHIHTLDLGNVVNGGAIVEGSLLVNVKTNNAKGYKLGVKAAAGSLVGENDTNNTIPGGTPEVGKSFWGFKVAAGTNNANLTIVEDYATEYNKLTTANTNISNSSKATDTNGTDTKVTFGVSASATQAADTYKQTVTFTAATEATVVEP